MATGEVRIFLKRGECDVEWNIPELDSSSMSNDWLYYSPNFQFGGVLWDMAIWPNCKQYSNTERYIDVGVRRYVSGSPIHVHFSFSLKTQNGQKVLERQSTEVFDGYSWLSIDRFLPRSEYGRRKSVFLVSGFFTIVCILKPLNADAAFNHLRKQYEDSQLMLEKTVMEMDFYKKELEFYNSEYKNLLNEKLDIEPDLNATTENLDCKKNVDTENISTLEKKCMDSPVKCPNCSEAFPLKEWHDNENQAAETEDGTNASPFCVVLLKSKIFNDLKQLFLSQENSDVVLRVKGQEFAAHNAILTARSPVFASTFRNDMKEKETGIVNIEDCDPSSFSDFLCFLYCEELGGLSQENMFSLFTIADKYDVTDLRTKCLEFMKENMCVDTFCETITMALQHSENELLLLSTDFFINNAEEILETVKWQSFAIENPIKSNEMFIKYVKSMKHSKK